MESSFIWWNRIYHSCHRCKWDLHQI